MISEDYLCAHYGKWHLGNDLIPQHGFEQWRSIEDWHLNAGTTTKKEHRFLESDYNTWLRSHGVEPPSGQSYETWVTTAGLAAEMTQAGYLGDEASRFIREHPSVTAPRPARSCCSPRSLSRIRPTPAPTTICTTPRRCRSAPRSCNIRKAARS